MDSQFTTWKTEMPKGRTDDIRSRKFYKEHGYTAASRATAGRAHSTFVAVPGIWPESLRVFSAFRLGAMANVDSSAAYQAEEIM